MQRRRSKYRNVIVAIVITFVASRLIFAAVGFRYVALRDPFDAGKLAIDLATWGVLYAVTLWLLNRAER